MVRISGSGATKLPAGYFGSDSKTGTDQTDSPSRARDRVRTSAQRSVPNDSDYGHKDFVAGSGRITSTTCLKHRPSTVSFCSEAGIALPASDQSAQSRVSFGISPFGVKNRLKALLQEH
ncbi:hypothetical protein BC939DRAFT_454454 [Gamsiella multidivaricata]|uniref:uncharacterized protein n=1 Tax=Gamsiella multidivaricata TaxID=101098 RepID=UPI0022205E98|nr:uncharacterized protein BC939DRAFT_454454 [Gamsiella multidivaricata]KAI7822000.1 hypothetical protein BC939DRAFT_454454 [Gamsiella multidivaricata]